MKKNYFILILIFSFSFFVKGQENNYDFVWLGKVKKTENNFVQDTKISGLSGTYTIGSTLSGNDFNSLTEALTQLGTQGAAGAVIFELSEFYSYTSETFPVTVNTYPGISASNNLTVKVKSGCSKVLYAEGLNDYDGVLEISAPYVTVDGSNNGDNSRNLSFSNVSVNIAAGIYVDANNVTVKNCNVEVSNDNSQSLGVYVKGNDNFVINCKISTSPVGILAEYAYNLSLSYNVIGNTAKTSGILRYGIYVSNSSLSMLRNNEISNLNLNSDGICAGISLNDITGNFYFLNNKISNIRAVLDNSVAFGVQISNYSGGTMNFVNNIVSGVVSRENVSLFPAGIYFNNPDITSDIKILHNTVYMPADTEFGFASELPFEYSSGIYFAEGSGTYEMRNNIIHNEYGRMPGYKVSNLINSYAIFIEGTTNPFYLSDYNLSYAGGDVDNWFAVRANNTDMDIFQWNTWSGCDANSWFSVALLDTENKPQPCSPAIVKATYLSNAAYDIEGTERDVLYPTIGAYEYIPEASSEISFLLDAKLQGNLSWTSGNGCKRAVFMKEGNLEEKPAPLNGISYVANSEFGSGDQIGTSGWFCVYDGNESICSVSGLSGEYTVMVCDYWGTPGYIVYNLTETFDNPRVINTVADVTVINTDARIYPNPAKNKIYIDNINSANAIISISDISGKIVINKEFTANTENYINIETIRKGIYLLKISDGEKISVLKFVKN